RAPWRLVAPRKGRAAPAAPRGKLPLRLGRQAGSAGLAVGERAVPAHLDRRPVLAPRYRLEATAAPRDASLRLVKIGPELLILRAPQPGELHGELGLLVQPARELGVRDLLGVDPKRGERDGVSRLLALVDLAPAGVAARLLAERHRARDLFGLAAH